MIHTSQDKQDNPVHDQNGPEDRNIKHGEPTAHEADGDGAGSGVPELEFGQTANKRSEFLIALGGETGRAGVAVLQSFVLGERGVEFGGQESEEQVQEIDAEGVCDCEKTIQVSLGTTGASSIFHMIVIMVSEQAVEQLWMLHLADRPLAR